MQQSPVLRVEATLHGEQVERVVGEVLTLLHGEELRARLPRVGERDELTTAIEHASAGRAPEDADARPVAV